MSKYLRGWRYVGLLILCCFAAWWLTPVRGYAVQPYGGCDEAWQAPHSQGARDCRALGWHVTHRLVVGPRQVIRFNQLPHCTVEDGSSGPLPCTWNVGPAQDGNGIGDAYWLDRHDRTHYVWTTGLPADQEYLSHRQARRYHARTACRMSTNGHVRCPNGRHFQTGEDW